MSEQEIVTYINSGRIISKREKKRKIKTAFDKKLLAIWKQQNVLWDKKRNLPLVPLEVPYQNGWIRYFVLRDDVRASVNADFYEHILEKINTNLFSHNKNFTKRKRVRRKKISVPREQFLKKLSLYDLNSPKLGLTDKEKKLFSERKEYNSYKKGFDIYYYFDEPWRFRLRVRPNMITHRQSIDADLESEMAQLENYIERKFLRHKICKLRDGNVYKFENKKIDVNPLKNKSLTKIYEEYERNEI